MRRIVTPADLGAAVREARTAAHLTQAELATRAGVSREWLIGLERGSRPRAELTKILGVLSALDQPLMLGREESAEPSSKGGESFNRGTGMSTAEVTRRAIERTRQPTAESAHMTPAGDRARGAVAGASSLAASMQEITKMTGAMLPTDFTRHFASQLASMMPKMDVSSHLSPTDFSALFPKMDVSTLMPQPSPALISLMQELSALQHTVPADDRVDEDLDGATFGTREETSPASDDDQKGKEVDQ